MNVYWGTDITITWIDGDSDTEWRQKTTIREMSCMLITNLYLSFILENDVNSSPSGQNGRHFADDILRCLFVNEKFCILIEMALKFVPRGPIDNNPALV